MVQFDSASESTLSQQAQLRGDELVELCGEDISARPREKIHNWWERYLFWYEMHDNISGSVGFAHPSLSCFGDYDQM